MRAHESGGRHLAPRASKRHDIDGDPKIQVPVVQTEHHTFWCFGDNREHANPPRRARCLVTTGLQTKWRDEAIAHGHERTDPPGGAAEHSQGGGRSIEGCFVHDQTIGIADARLGKEGQCCGVNRYRCCTQGRLPLLDRIAPVRPQ